MASDGACGTLEMESTDTFGDSLGLTSLERVRKVKPVVVETGDMVSLATLLRILTLKGCLNPGRDDPPNLRALLGEPIAQAMEQLCPQVFHLHWVELPPERQQKLLRKEAQRQAEEEKLREAMQTVQDELTQSLSQHEEASQSVADHLVSPPAREDPTRWWRDSDSSELLFPGADADAFVGKTAQPTSGATTGEEGEGGKTSPIPPPPSGGAGRPGKSVAPTAGGGLEGQVSKEGASSPSEEEPPEQKSPPQTTPMWYESGAATALQSCAGAASSDAFARTGEDSLPTAKRVQEHPSLQIHGRAILIGAHPEACYTLPGIGQTRLQVSSIFDRLQLLFHVTAVPLQDWITWALACQTMPSLPSHQWDLLPLRYRTWKEGERVLHRAFAVCQDRSFRQDTWTRRLFVIARVRPWHLIVPLWDDWSTTREMVGKEVPLPPPRALQSMGNLVTFLDNCFLSPQALKALRELVNRPRFVQFVEREVRLAPHFTQGVGINILPPILSLQADGGTTEKGSWKISNRVVSAAQLQRLRVSGTSPDPAQDQSTQSVSAPSPAKTHSTPLLPPRSTRGEAEAVDVVGGADVSDEGMEVRRVGRGSKMLPHELTPQIPPRNPLQVQRRGRGQRPKLLRTESPLDRVLNAVRRGTGAGIVRQ